MTGWKTWSAGIVGILSGVVALILYFTEGTGDIAAGMGLIVGGLAALGIGHKIEKAAG